MLLAKTSIFQCKNWWRASLSYGVPITHSGTTMEKEQKTAIENKRWNNTWRTKRETTIEEQMKNNWNKEQEQWRKWRESIISFRFGVF